MKSRIKRGLATLVLGALALNGCGGLEGLTPKPTYFPKKSEPNTMTYVEDGKEDPFLFEKERGWEAGYRYFNLNEDKFKIKAPGSKWKYEELVYGVASHDLYHAGQIQLIKRLVRK